MTSPRRRIIALKPIDKLIALPILLLAATLMFLVFVEADDTVLDSTTTRFVSGAVALLVASCALPRWSLRYRRVVSLVLTVYALYRGLILLVVPFPVGVLWLYVALTGPLFINARTKAE